MKVMSSHDAHLRFGRATVRHKLKTGMWQRPERGVIVTHNGPLTRQDKWRIVVAAAPAHSVLGGLTALYLAGLEGFDSDRTFLIVRNGGRKPKIAGTEMHQSIHLRADDVLWAHDPPRTRNARSIIDAATWCKSDRLARAVTIAAFQQGLVSTRQIREALQRRPTQKRRGLVVESVLDAAGGIQSLPERDFEQVRIKAGLTKPVRQRPVKGKDGRYFLDVWFEREQLAVEIHGIPHMAVRKWDAGLFRANEIVITGRRLLAFSSYAVRHHPLEVVDQLRRAAGLPDVKQSWSSQRPELRELRPQGRSA